MIIKKVWDKFTKRKSLDRDFLSFQYIKGEGIEIGALHNPLPIRKSQAVVRYVDRLNEKDLRLQYPELNGLPLVEVDYLADGELLESIKNSSQDFVIANHFIEHCQNPILAIRNMLRVLKIGRVVFMAIPDKRYTFDLPREVTPLSHIIHDYQNGPAASKEQHFREWVKTFNGDKDETFIAEEAVKLMNFDYSIHFHVWTKKDVDELLLYLINELKFGFEIELSYRKTDSYENIYILRKLSEL
jgi:predicted SAM-dependent methyltransferase